VDIFVKQRKKLFSHPGGARFDERLPSSVSPRPPQIFLPDPPMTMPIRNNRVISFNDFTRLPGSSLRLAGNPITGNSDSDKALRKVIENVKSPKPVTTPKASFTPIHFQVTADSLYGPPRELRLDFDKNGDYFSRVPADPAGKTLIKIPLGKDGREAKVKLKLLMNEPNSKIKFVLDVNGRVTPNSFGRDTAAAVGSGIKQTYIEWRNSAFNSTKFLPPGVKDLVDMFTGAGLKLGANLAFTIADLGDALAPLIAKITATDESWNKFVNDNFKGDDPATKAFRASVTAGGRPVLEAADPKLLMVVMLVAYDRAQQWIEKKGDAGVVAAFGKGLRMMIRDELKELDPKSFPPDAMGGYIGTVLGSIGDLILAPIQMGTASLKMLKGGAKLAAKLGKTTLINAGKKLEQAGELVQQLRALKGAGKLNGPELDKYNKLLNDLQAATKSADAGDATGFSKAVKSLEETLDGKPVAKPVAKKVMRVTKAVPLTNGPGGGPVAPTVTPTGNSKIKPLSTEIRKKNPLTNKLEPETLDQRVKKGLSNFIDPNEPPYKRPADRSQVNGGPVNTPLPFTSEGLIPRSNPSKKLPKAPGNSARVAAAFDNLMVGIKHDTLSFVTPGDFLTPVGARLSPKKLGEQLKALQSKLKAAGELTPERAKSIRQMQWRIEVKKTITEFDSLVNSTSRPPPGWDKRAEQLKLRLNGLQKQAEKAGWNEDALLLGRNDSKFKDQLTNAKEFNAGRPQLQGNQAGGGAIVKADPPGQLVRVIPPDGPYVQVPLANKKQVDRILGHPPITSTEQYVAMEALLATSRRRPLTRESTVTNFANQTRSQIVFSLTPDPNQFTPTTANPTPQHIARQRFIELEYGRLSTAELASVHSWIASDWEVLKQAVTDPFALTRTFSSAGAGDGVAARTVAQAASVFTSAAEKLPRVYGTFYKGIDLQPTELSKFTPGAKIELTQYTAASAVRPLSAFSDRNTQFVLVAGDGPIAAAQTRSAMAVAQELKHTPASMGGDGPRSLIHANPTEAEVMFLPNSRFNVLSVEQTTNRRGRPITIITMKHIPR
jgi:hypothetical protein